MNLCFMCILIFNPKYHHCMRFIVKRSVVPIYLFCIQQSKEAGIKTLVALDDQGGK